MPTMNVFKLFLELIFNLQKSCKNSSDSLHIFPQPASPNESILHNHSSRDQNQGLTMGRILLTFWPLFSSLVTIVFTNLVQISLGHIRLESKNGKVIVTKLYFSEYKLPYRGERTSGPFTFLSFINCSLATS